MINAQLSSLCKTLIEHFRHFEIKGDFSSCSLQADFFPYFYRDMPISTGSTVTVQYKLYAEDNRLLYESAEPLTFTVGADDILPAFEANLMGLNAGDRHRFTLSPEEAYGPYHEDLVFTLSRQQLRDDGEDIVPGQTLTLYTPEGESLLVTVLDVTDTTIKVDANHPLAGQTLIYEVEVLNVL